LLLLALERLTVEILSTIIPWVFVGPKSVGWACFQWKTIEYKTENMIARDVFYDFLNLFDAIPAPAVKSLVYDFLLGREDTCIHTN